LWWLYNKSLTTYSIKSEIWIGRAGTICSFDLDRPIFKSCETKRNMIWNLELLSWIRMTASLMAPPSNCLSRTLSHHQDQWGQWYSSVRFKQPTELGKGMADAVSLKQMSYHSTCHKQDQDHRQNPWRRFINCSKMSWGSTSTVILEWSYCCYYKESAQHHGIPAKEHQIMIRRDEGPKLQGTCLTTSGLSLVEYCSIIWDPHTKVGNTQAVSSEIFDATT
jgi:hypothetical protein